MNKAIYKVILVALVIFCLVWLSIIWNAVDIERNEDRLNAIEGQVAFQQQEIVLLKRRIISEDAERQAKIYEMHREAYEAVQKGGPE